MMSDRLAHQKASSNRTSEDPSTKPAEKRPRLLPNVSIPVYYPPTARLPPVPDSPRFSPSSSQLTSTNPTSPPLQALLDTLVSCSNIGDATGRQNAIATTSHSILSLFAHRLEENIDLNSRLEIAVLKLEKAEDRIKGMSEGIARADGLERELNGLKRENASLLSINKWKENTSNRDKEEETRLIKEKMSRVDRLEDELLQLKRCMLVGKGDKGKDETNQIKATPDLRAITPASSSTTKVIPTGPRISPSLSNTSHPSLPKRPAMIPTPTLPSSQRVSNLQNEIKRLQARISALTRVNASLRVEVAGANKQRHDQVAGLREELRVATEKNMKLRQNMSKIYEAATNALLVRTATQDELGGLEDGKSKVEVESGANQSAPAEENIIL